MSGKVFWLSILLWETLMKVGASLVGARFPISHALRAAGTHKGCSYSEGRSK